MIPRYTSVQSPFLRSCDRSASCDMEQPISVHTRSEAKASSEHRFPGRSTRLASLLCSADHHIEKDSPARDLYVANLSRIVCEDHSMEGSHSGSICTTGHSRRWSRSIRQLGCSVRLASLDVPCQSRPLATMRLRTRWGLLNAGDSNYNSSTANPGEGFLMYVYIRGNNYCIFLLSSPDRSGLLFIM
jgi:hypothetical protein